MNNNQLPILQWQDQILDLKNFSIELREQEGKLSFTSVKHNDFPFRVLLPPAITKYPKLSEYGNYIEGNPFKPDKERDAKWMIDLWEIDGNGQLNPYVKFFFDTVVQPLDDWVLDQVYSHRDKLDRKYAKKSKEEVKEYLFRPSLKVCPKTGFRFMTMSRKIFHRTQNDIARAFLPICDMHGKVIDYTPDSYDLVRVSGMPKTITQGQGTYGLQWELHTVQVVERASERPPPEFIPEFSAENSQAFMTSVQTAMKALE